MAAEPPERTRGVYMISVAAELAGMHPQTLRLKRIQELTSELGMNLAGVERVFELEDEIERMRRRMRNIERQAERVQAELAAEIERVRRSFKRELVVYEPPGQDLMRPDGPRPVRVPILPQWGAWMTSSWRTQLSPSKRMICIASIG